MASSYLSPALRNLVSTLRRFESEYPYMYVDSRGNVTVGIGHNLVFHYGDLRRLSFTVKRLERHAVSGDKGIPIASPERLNRSATYDEVVNDYDFLNSHSRLGHYSASGMAKYTTVELSSIDIRGAFADDCGEAVRTCRAEFKAPFDTFPITCQAALIDIAFNCGNFHSFRHTLVPAIKGMGMYGQQSLSARWVIAAGCVKRSVGNLSRDQTVRQWFMQGSQECAQMERQAV